MRSSSTKQPYNFSIEFFRAAAAAIDATMDDFEKHIRRFHVQWYDSTLGETIYTQRYVAYVLHTWDMSDGSEND